MNNIDEMRFGDEQARAAVTKDMFELRAARGRVDRNDDSSKPSAAKDHLHELDPVPAEQRDVIAPLHAMSGQ